MSPNLSSVQALNGRIFETLTADEKAVVEFYVRYGRKFDLAISILSEVHKSELMAAQTCAEAESIIKGAKRRVTVSAKH